MSSLTRFNPFRDLEAFSKRVEDFFNMRDLTAFAGWKPSVDIKELPEHFEVVAELPGVKKEDVELTLENGVLSLSGERRTEAKDEHAKAHRIERSFGRFERVFTLPETADPTRVDASFADGMLHVKIAKRPVPDKKSTRIPIT